MTAEHLRGDDGWETLTLYGVVHRMEVSTKDGPGGEFPLIVDVSPTESALLSQEHIDALHKFLTPYVTKDLARIDDPQDLLP